jgi:ubiquinone/menaquinone biosynthesis C-methylase UbiE
MSLSTEYHRQREWRAWPKIFDALPLPRGQTVLDLGCGVGDQAAELVARELA